MHSYQRAFAVACATFGASVIGMLLQHIMPAQVLTDSKGTVGAMVGLITLLLALVLGLLVYTAFTGLHDSAERGVWARPRGDRTGRGSGGIWPRGFTRTGGLKGGAGALAQAVFWRPETWSAGPHVRGNPGDDALDEHLFRQPSALDGPAATTPDLSQGPRENLRRDSNADGPATRQSVPPATARRRHLVGLGALSRQRPRRRAERGFGDSPSSGRDRRRQRGFSDSGAEPPLFGRDPPSTGCWRRLGTPRRARDRGQTRRTDHPSSDFWRNRRRIRRVERRERHVAVSSPLAWAA